VKVEELFRNKKRECLKDKINEFQIERTKISEKYIEAK
jgi:hypothetical protein